MPIEQLRTMLIIGLVLVSFLIWQAWQEDYGPKPTAVDASAPVAAPASGPTITVDVPVSPPSSAPAASASAGATVDVPALPGQVEAPPGVAADPALVHARTDLLDVTIDANGGTLQDLKLLAYAETAADRSKPFTLLSPAGKDVFLVQSGLVGNEQAPTHRTLLAPAGREHALADGQDTLVVPMAWRSGDGVEVTKRFVFTRDSYVVRIEYEVRNGSAQPWSARMYGQLHRNEVERKGGLFSTYTYTGGVLSQADKPYQKIDFDDMASQDLDATYQGGWVAMIQHYFAAAVVPPPQGENHFYTKALGNARFVLGAMGPAQTLAPGAAGTFAMDVYAGPKVQERMQSAAAYLERTVDYGWLWFIAEPLFFAMRWINGFVGNWGFSIIILTLCVKALFFHLSAASYKSMARMRKLQPRILHLRERYAADKARMNQAMMELYKTEKINPLGGCLPILVQIPVFISLYWVLLESVELRHSPFVLWITDLSGYDPYFVLPLLMGASMFVQQRLNPAPPDPIQAKVMMMLPIVFTFLFLFFPSGLVLYWFVNNLLSIAQQWVITRKIVGPDS